MQRVKCDSDLNEEKVCGAFRRCPASRAISIYLYQVFTSISITYKYKNKLIGGLVIMRIKDFRSGAEKLSDIMSVCEDMKFTEVEVSEVIDALAAVRADVFLYVQNWAYKEGKQD